MASRLNRTRFLILIFLLASCFNNAERDNPLDPGSDQYQNFGLLEGHVYTLYAPFQPITTARITLLPDHQTALTDEYGAFYFKHLIPGNYLVTIDSENYASDSTQVAIASNRTTTIQFNLDGLPCLDSLNLNSGFEHEFLPFEPSRLLDCKAKVFDPDGPADIATVTILIPQFGFKDTLGISSVVNIYQKSYRESDLPINNIEQLIGHSFFIEITDKAGKTCRYGPNYLFRVIADEPIIESPRGAVSVGAQPLLKWNPIQLSYPVTVKVEIYALFDYQPLYPAIRVFANIPADITEFQIDKPLNENTYLWTVSIVDEFGNWSRSKPATFQVGGTAK